jgi:hypothetical protein
MMLFCKAMRSKVQAPGLSGGEKATSLRSQVVRVGHAPPLGKPRSTWQGGDSGPRCIPPVQGLCPLKIPPPPARGGRAHGPLGRGRGALAGALCVCGQTPAAWRGSGLTWAGQPPRTLDGARHGRRGAYEKP